MPKRKDTATFVAQARAIHGDRYDYSRVEYHSQHVHVEIICSKHGVFRQRPHSHRRGMGCRKCGTQNRTDLTKHFCRFCGVRVMYRDAHKKRCQSEDCLQRYEAEKQEASWLKKRWRREKKRQRQSGRTDIEKRCVYAYRNAWMAKRYRTKTDDGIEKPIKPITEKLLKQRAREKRRWASFTAMEKKVKYFVRETNSGRRHMASRKGKIKMRDLLQKMEQQGNRCALSGQPIDHLNSEIDHILPVSRGGSSEMENLQWLSRTVNRMKGTMTNEEFVEACKLVVEHTLPPSPRPLLGPLWSK